MCPERSIFELPMRASICHKTFRPTRAFQDPRRWEIICRSIVICRLTERITSAHGHGRIDQSLALRTRKTSSPVRHAWHKLNPQRSMLVFCLFSWRPDAAHIGNDSEETDQSAVRQGINEYAQRLILTSTREAAFKSRFEALRASLFIVLKSGCTRLL